MTDPPPAAVALADQLQAEMMDVARDRARSQLADAPLSDTKMALLEAGYMVGFAAGLVVLNRHGWLRKPTDDAS